MEDRHIHQWYMSNPQNQIDYFIDENTLHERMQTGLWRIPFTRI